MILRRYRQLSLGWLYWCLLLGSVAWTFMLPTAHAENTDDDSPGLTLHYERLYKHYNDHHAQIKSDCKLKADKVGDDDQDHIHWGTFETLEFLSGNRDIKDTSIAEQRMKLPKLRQFLTRVGFLKDPGSLVFLDKQSQTMRLTACGKGALWRQQGEAFNDKKFQEEHIIGDKFKGQTPNAVNYIHKYICFRKGKDEEKCSHTFYVISKMLPELPLGLLVRENKEANEFEFACTVPICRLKNCHQPGEKASIPRRAYPPFKIYWVIPETLSKVLKDLSEVLKDLPTDHILTKQLFDPVKERNEVKGHFNIVWENLLRKDKEGEYTSKESYGKIDASFKFVDGFGNENRKEAVNDLYALHSRIHILKGDEETQVGQYECVIEDANGVVTTPNKMKEDYRGKANIHIIHDEMYFTYVVAGICCVITAIIIMICPKKMEHDDGTPYTKDELVSPAEHHDIVNSTASELKTAGPAAQASTMSLAKKEKAEPSQGEISAKSKEGM